MKMKPGIRLFAILLLCACLAACAKPAADVNLSDLMDKMEDAVTFDSSVSDMTMEQLTSLYGISSAQVSQFSGKLATSGILADEAVMIEAKDASAAEAVKAAVEGRYQAKLAEMKDYLPDEYSKISACEVLQKGNFIAMFVADPADAKAMTDLFHAAV